MKVAAPLFGTRVSPRFDCAASFLVAEVDSGRVIECSEVTAQGTDPAGRAKWLMGLGVGAVICGGIDAHSAQVLELNSIAVCPWVTGEAEDALRAFAEGRLEPMMMMSPGGRCCGRWRFRGGGRQGGAAGCGRGPGRGMESK